nr:MAG TPA: hypothetical protein [Caudoviricetes sp.]
MQSIYPQLSRISLTSSAGEIFRHACFCSTFLRFSTTMTLTK